jgi:hypothetical protein
LRERVEGEGYSTTALHGCVCVCGVQGTLRSSQGLGRLWEKRERERERRRGAGGKKGEGRGAVAVAGANKFALSHLSSPFRFIHRSA